MYICLLKIWWAPSIQSSEKLRLVEGWSKKGAPMIPRHCPVGWGCRIHRLDLCWGVNPHNEYPRYDTKQSDGEAPVMLGLCGMWSTSSLPLLPGPFWPGVVTHYSDRTNGILMLNWIVWLNWIAWNRNVFDN